MTQLMDSIYFLYKNETPNTKEDLAKINDFFIREIDYISKVAKNIDRNNFDNDKDYQKYKDRVDRIIQDIQLGKIPFTVNMADRYSPSLTDASWGGDNFVAFNHHHYGDSLGGVHAHELGHLFRFDKFIEVNEFINDLEFKSQIFTGLNKYFEKSQKEGEEIRAFLEKNKLDDYSEIKSKIKDALKQENYDLAFKYEVIINLVADFLERELLFNFQSRPNSNLPYERMANDYMAYMLTKAELSSFFINLIRSLELNTGQKIIGNNLDEQSKKEIYNYLYDYDGDIMVLTIFSKISRENFDKIIKPFSEITIYGD